MLQDSQITSALDHFNAGRYQEAESAFIELEKRFPNSFIAPLYLAQIALVRGTGPDWIETLKRALLNQPYIADGYYVLGQCYRQNKQLPEASEAFHQALSVLINQQSLSSTDSFLDAAFKKNLQGFDRKAGEELLWTTLAQLKQAGVFAFAAAGTLLGLEREGQLLENDKDIDIGVEWLQMSKTLDLLESLGWEEVARSYDLINPRCMKHKKTGIIMDVCGYGTDTQTGEAISGLWMDNVPFEWNRITYFPEVSLTSKATPFGDVWHLKKPIEFLVALYGEEWRLPDPLFDTIICARNQRLFSWLSYCYGYSRLYVYCSRGQYKKALRNVETLLIHAPSNYVLQAVQEHLIKVIELTEVEKKVHQPTRVLALGYFDLFHQGHLNYLNFSSKQGDSLIVGVSQDAFCQKSKGYTPIMSQEMRLNLIASFSIVDEAVLVAYPLAETEKAAQWIHSLNINVVVCGEEWEGSERWNALTLRLQQDGIKVVFAPKTQGISTTMIKQKIKSELS